MTSIENEMTKIFTKVGVCKDAQDIIMGLKSEMEKAEENKIWYESFVWAMGHKDIGYVRDGFLNIDRKLCEHIPLALIKILTQMKIDKKVHFDINTLIIKWNCDKFSLQIENLKNLLDDRYDREVIIPVINDAVKLTIDFVEKESMEAINNIRTRVGLPRVRLPGSS